MDMKKILVMNGPNLDMLGTREPEIYGNDTLAALEEHVMQYGAKQGIEVSCFQSNSESKLINQIHKAAQNYDGVVFNPGAHTHYSYAIRDAIGSIDTPVVEVHISDIDEREPFRAISVTAPACVGQVKGLGFDGYLRGIDILLDLKEPLRLGEGYEKRYPTSQNIIVASESESFDQAANESDAEYIDSTVDSIDAINTGFVDSGGTVDVVDAGLNDDALDLTEQDEIQIEDRTRAYDEQIVLADAGLLSFERLNLLRLSCARLGVGALYVRDTPNIQWLTALDGVFDDERAHALLVAANLALLHTDSRYSNAMVEAIEKAGVAVSITDERMSHAQFAYRTLNPPDRERFEAKLGIEDSITYAEYVSLVEEFSTEWLAPTSDVVLKLRAVKDANEITRIKTAQAITDAAFDHIVAFMKPGMTERQVQMELEHFMLTHGAEGLAFRSIVACGHNGADPHAVPGDTKLEAGQCVVLDFGARSFGYCSDMTRTVFLGTPDELMRNAWNTLRQANEQVRSILRPGVTGKEAHDLAERVLEENGFGGMMGHGLGHGVGLEVHELPVLSPRNEMPLVVGNVVTVEPGIYISGNFGMRLEDFGAITEEGFDVFTQSTHEMVII